MGKLTVVGMGPGGVQLLTAEALEALGQASMVLAAARIAAVLPRREGVHKMEGMQDALKAVGCALPQGDVAVCVSGDPGLYSMQGLLRRSFPNTEIAVVSGVGSLQYLCDRLGESRENAVVLSAHGRELTDGRLVGTVACNAMTLLLLDGRHDPAWLCETLRTYGLDDVRIAVGEQLSYPEERIVEGVAQELADQSFSGLCAARVFNDKPQAVPVGFGLQDGLFLRGEVPMTKAEVRAVALSRLELHEEAVVWDIGAGTGSVAVECARLCRYGIVHAVEREADALELIGQNRSKFGLHNLVIHSGEAPSALDALPCPTHVFVGGSGGELPEILRHVARRGPGIRVVVAAVTLETSALAAAMMGAPPFQDMELTQVNVSRSRRAGKYNLMMAHNPVTLISARTGEQP